MSLMTLQRALTSAGGAVQAGAGLLADLVFPRRCGLCGAFGAYLCGRCTAALPVLDGPRCPRCAAPLAPAGACPFDHTEPGPLDALTAAFRFEAGARRLVHRLKYERLAALAEPMGALMAGYLTPQPPSLKGRGSTGHDPSAWLPCDLAVARIGGGRAGESTGHDPSAWLPSPLGEGLGERSVLLAPVPLHPRRERERGFNQAALLARAIGRVHGLEVDARALRRVRATRPQVRTGSAAERAANVDGAFACREALTGRTVLLIDDVATTGATLRACAAALRESGAAAVHALVFAHEA